MKEDKRVAEFVAEAAKAAGLRATEDFMHNYENVAKACGSPIERLLLAALIDSLSITEPSWTEGYVHYLARGPEFPSVPAPFVGAYLWPQAQVDRFRADFLIFVRAKEGQTSWIAVECDGHEFHERTKEQAARDRSRDRWMTANGIAVLRFTGMEIWRDPNKCADDVVALIEKMMGE